MITQTQLASVLVRFAGVSLTICFAMALTWCVVAPPLAINVLGPLPSGVDPKLVIDAVRPQFEVGWKAAAAFDSVMLVIGLYCIVGGSALVNFLCRPTTGTGAA